jgi:hypothetical protein
VRIASPCIVSALAGCLFAAVSPSPAWACGTGAVLLHDKFESLDGWGDLTSDVSVSGGTMRITQPPQRWYRFSNQTDLFTDTNICLDMSIVAAGALQESPYFSLIFWRRQNDFYRLAVSGSGVYFIGRHWNGQVTFPRAWTAAPSLKKGLNVWNGIEVRTRGNTVAFRLNGSEVARLNALQPRGGGLVGFEWSSAKERATVAIRNFRIEADDKKGL